MILELLTLQICCIDVSLGVYGKLRVLDILKGSYLLEQFTIRILFSQTWWTYQHLSQSRPFLQEYMGSIEKFLDH